MFVAKMTFLRSPCDSLEGKVLPGASTPKSPAARRQPERRATKLAAHHSLRTSANCQAREISVAKQHCCQHGWMDYRIKIQWSQL